jgi:prefoldin subunit 5
MATKKKLARVGDHIPPKLRRIGSRHAVVTLGTSVQLLDIQTLDRQIAKLSKHVAALEAERVKCQEKIDDLRATREAFGALTVQRDEEDPDVAQD